jgi:hypothetical protein
MFAVKLSVCVKSSPIFRDFWDKYSQIPVRRNRVFSGKFSIEGDRSGAEKPGFWASRVRQFCTLDGHQLRVSGSIPNSRNR